MLAYAIVEKLPAVHSEEPPVLPAVRTLHAGGRAQAITGPPGGVAARLRFPISRGNRSAA
jgi:hypothetical protein